MFGRGFGLLGENDYLCSLDGGRFDGYVKLADTTVLSIIKMSSVIP